MEVERLRYQKIYILKCIDGRLKRLFLYELEIGQGYPKIGNFKKLTVQAVQLKMIRLDDYNMLRYSRNPKSK